MRYSLVGEYEYPGRNGRFTGEVEIGSDDEFSARIHDETSVVPEQSIVGKIRTRHGVAELAFVKSSERTDLADILYALQRTGAGDGWAGTYEGRYTPLPRALEKDANAEEKRLATIVPGSPFVWLFPEELSTSYARVTLERMEK